MALGGFALGLQPGLWLAQRLQTWNMTPAGKRPASEGESKRSWPGASCVFFKEGRSCPCLGPGECHWRPFNLLMPIRSPGFQIHQLVQRPDCFQAVSQQCAGCTETPCLLRWLYPWAVPLSPPLHTCSIYLLMGSSPVSRRVRDRLS